MQATMMKLGLGLVAVMLTAGVSPAGDRGDRDGGRGWNRSAMRHGDAGQGRNAWRGGDRDGWGRGHVVIQPYRPQPVFVQRYYYPASTYVTERQCYMVYRSRGISFGW